MTTPTSMGNHGGTVTSCSPYAYPGFAEICILLRTWSTVTPGTCELAFLIKKKKRLVNLLSTPPAESLRLRSVEQLAVILSIMQHLSFRVYFTKFDRSNMFYTCRTPP